MLQELKWLTEAACSVTTKGDSDDLVSCVVVQFFDLVCPFIRPSDHVFNAKTLYVCCQQAIVWQSVAEVLQAKKRDNVTWRD